MSEHVGVPPTCGCTDYGVHRALKRLDYERNAGRISARELGGKYKEDWDRRVSEAECALEREQKLTAMPGRVNPTPGQLIKELKDLESRHYGLLGRISAAIRAFRSS